MRLAILRKYEAIFYRGQRTQSSVEIPGELPEAGQLINGILEGPKMQEDRMSPWRTVGSQLGQGGHTMVPAIKVEMEG